MRDEPDATGSFARRAQPFDAGSESALRRSRSDRAIESAGEMAFLEPLFRRLAERERTSGARPFVTLSYAQSIDGSIALQPARPLALSSERAFAMAHVLRAHHSALLVGINTVAADNPRLTVRLCEGVNPQPVVLDSRLRITEDRLLFAHPDRHPWLLTTDGAPKSRRERLQARGAVVHVLPSDHDGRVDLAAALERLGELGIKRLMVEGGAQVIGSLLRSRLVDYCVITVAPKLLFGGLKAMDPQAEATLPALSLAPCAYQPLGSDLIIHGSLAEP